MTTWQLWVGGGLLAVAAVESWQARLEIAKVRQRMELMHTQLLKLMHKQGVDPLE